MAGRGLMTRMFGGARSRGNYPYVAARVRARKPKLIPTEEYQKLLAMDVNSIARTLQEGEYKQEVDELGGKYQGAQLVEHATRLKLSRTYREILGWSQGELKELIQLYLARYDVYNVKTVLRGIRSNASDEEIGRALIPAGALSSESLQDLARLTSFEDVVNGLQGTPFGAVLKKGMEGSGASNLSALENDLDKRYYSMLVDAVKPDGAPKRAFLSYVRREADVVNLRTLIRLKLDGVEDAEDYLLPEAKDVTPELGRRLLRAGADEWVQALSDTDLAPAAEGVRKTLETSDLEFASDALERLLVESGHSFSHLHPLSVLPILDYLLRLRMEVDDLRVIAYGKQTHLKEETIKELVTR